MIGFFRDEQADIDAARGGELEGGEERLIRHEVAGGQPDALPGGVEHEDERHLDRISGRVRAVGHRSERAGSGVGAGTG